MPTVYLDTANWIDLAERRCRTDDFEKVVFSGRLNPVLSFVHILELANQHEPGIKKVSGYIDLIRSKATIRWALLQYDIEQTEVETAFAQFLGIESSRIPRIRPFRDSLVETLPDHPEDPISDELRNESVGNQVENLRSHPAFVNEYLSERNRDFPELRHGVLREPRERILDYIPLHPPPGYPNLVVDEPVRRQFAEKVDIMNLPAFSMAVAYNQGMTQINGYQLSDYEDHLHLAGLAYCNVSFADARTCEALKQGNSKIMPKRNRDFKKWLSTL